MVCVNFAWCLRMELPLRLILYALCTSRCVYLDNIASVRCPEMRAPSLDFHATEFS